MTENKYAEGRGRWVPEGPTPPLGVARPGPRLGQVRPPRGASLSPLLALALLREIRNFGFCFIQFREYFLCKISETKNNRKQELALRHLVNRLVPENA